MILQTNLKNNLKSSEWKHFIDFAVASITDAVISIAYDLVTGFTRQGNGSKEQSRQMSQRK